MSCPQNKGPKLHADTPEHIASAEAANANQARQIDALEKASRLRMLSESRMPPHYIFISNGPQVVLDEEVSRYSSLNNYSSFFAVTGHDVNTHRKSLGHSQIKPPSLSRQIAEALIQIESATICWPAVMNVCAPESELESFHDKKPFS